MLDSVRLQRRQSEIRQELSALVGKTDTTEDEIRSIEKLDGEYRANETKYRAALIAEDQERRDAGADLETRSDREFAELIGRFELRQVALSLDEGRALSGATAEVVQELRAKGGYQGIPVPLAALETRAGETIAADVPNPVQTRPIIDRIFPNSVAERLGIQRINITSGEVEFPVATAGAIFGWQTTELGNVGGPSPFDTTERSLKPDHTGGCQMVISRKALKQSGEALEAAIRRDMNATIAAELDRIVINGSGTAGEPLGMVPGATEYGIPVTAVGATATWAAFRAQIVAFLEANAITAAGQVNLAFGPAIWAELDDALISGTAVSELDRLVKNVGSPAISNTIPDETAILTATVQGVPPGVLGIWGAVDLIRDPYTRAASGQLVLTGLVTADFVVPRGMQSRILTGIGAP